MLYFKHRCFASVRLSNHKLTVIAYYIMQFVCPSKSWLKPVSSFQPMKIGHIISTKPCWSVSNMVKDGKFKSTSTSRRVKLTWAERCNRNKLLSGYRWLRISFDRSMSFKIINFCTNRKPIYDFLLVIICDLGFIWYRFRDIAPRKKLKTPSP